MSILAEVVTVPATAGGIILAGPGGGGVDQRKVVVYQASGVTVYVGGAGVTTATGFPIPSGGSLSIELGPSDSLYGIVAAATQSVNVIQTRV